jgi:hypothetical protein
MKNEYIQHAGLDQHGAERRDPGFLQRVVGDILPKAEPGRSQGGSYRIALLACGSRGDIQPLIAVGDALRRRGHSVVMTVNENLAAWARKSGQPFRTKSTARPSDSASQTSAGRPYPLAHRSFQRRSRSRYNGPSLPTG